MPLVLLLVSVIGLESILAIFLRVNLLYSAMIIHESSK